MAEIQKNDKAPANHIGMLVKPQTFVVELVIDNQVLKSTMAGLNKESAVSLLTIATSVNFPRIQGWNLYDEKGDILASVDAVTFIGNLAAATPIGKEPADPKKAGWRALPVVTPTSDEFSKMIEAAKKEGKTPT
jgi:hypothetical protein